MAELPRNPDGSYNLRPKATGRGAEKLPAGFNVNSTQQVLKYLNQIGLDPRDPKTGKPTTDKKVLRPLADNPVVYALLAYKRAEKRRSMIQALLDKHVEEDGRIHPRFSPLATGTGRFTSSNPNAQQLPREPYIRDIFTAGEGMELIDCDVKGMEIGVSASAPIADEKNMQLALNEGLDAHKFTASKVFAKDLDDVTAEERRISKSLNFGLLYGSSAGGLKDYFASFGQAISLGEADELRRSWLAAYPAFAAWHAWAKQQAKTGEVRMVDGRRRWLIEDMARHTVYCNNQTQGTSASIVKLAMIEIHKRLPPGARFIAQVHDELLVEAPIGLGEEILELMKRQIFLAGRQIIGDSVDMIGEGSVAKSWGQAK